MGATVRVNLVCTRWWRYPCNGLLDLSQYNRPPQPGGPDGNLRALERTTCGTFEKLMESVRRDCGFGTAKLIKTIYHLKYIQQPGFVHPGAGLVQNGYVHPRFIIRAGGFRE